MTVPRDSLSASSASSLPAATMDVGRALRLWVVPALMYSILYSISAFYGTLFLIRFLYRWVRAPSDLFWRVSRRPVPPACLSDPSLGTHAYVQLKVRPGDIIQGVNVLVGRRPDQGLAGDISQEVNVIIEKCSVLSKLVDLVCQG